MMKYDAIVRTIKKAAKKAGIKKTINLKLFRHSQSSNLATFLTESQLKVRQGWTADSNMPGVYVHLSGKNIDPSIYNMCGWIDATLVEQTFLKDPSKHHDLKTL